jgi:hypothetical protein
LSSLQFFWAERLAHLGYGVTLERSLWRSIAAADSDTTIVTHPPASLIAHIAAAVQRARQPQTRLRCACLGVKIRAETGLATVVAAVQATVAAATAAAAAAAAPTTAIEDTSAVLEAGLQLLELPNAMTIAHVAGTQSEVVFLYEEVFTHEVYTQHGVTLPTHGGTVVDCGANIGLFSLYAALAVDTGCQLKVIAFEPAPLTAAALRHNLSKFCTAATAVCVQCAIGSADSDDGELW